MPDENNDSDLSGFARAFRKAAPYVNSVYVMMASIALFAWLGWLADEKWSMRPMFFIIGLFVGLITGFYNFYKILKNLDSDK